MKTVCMCVNADCYPDWKYCGTQERRGKHRKVCSRLAEEMPGYIFKNAAHNYTQSLAWYINDTHRLSAHTQQLQHKQHLIWIWHSSVSVNTDPDAIVLAEARRWIHYTVMWGSLKRKSMAEIVLSILLSLSLNTFHEDCKKTQMYLKNAFISLCKYHGIWI